ncbi:MAG: pyrroline-5-carboxylate reductase [Lachnospiraceae bacterium]|nr:pyrroline-5-carboxylate reductase [Lachnospiraceae bacterium]
MKIGFIGAGNMSRAILTGISKSEVLDSKNVFVSNRSKEKLESIESDFGFNVSTDNSYVIKNAKDVLFICVKPQVFDTIAKDIKKSINQKQLVVSIMAGKSIEYLEKTLGTKNIIRVMPNTPCLVGAGVSAVAGSEMALKNNNYNDVLEVLKTIGEVIEVDEKYINAITQVSGASPAWIFMMIEALADGGVECGLPRDMAYKFATSAVYGSGKLASMKYAENKTHPGVLKDMVTSPAGTTIEGVRVLEENGFRGAIIDAVLQSYSRSLEM